MVQPKLDYCSQFWSPGDQESINKIESIQRHFLSQVSCLKHLDYWEKLRAAKIYSQERRRERYMTIFLWKISQGMTSGYNLEFTSMYGIRGRTVLPKDIVMTSHSLVRKARESSIGVKGARIFNLLPVEIRNIEAENVAVFKNRLDAFISQIPDQPTTTGLGRPAETNSSLHQIPLYLLNQ